MRLIARSTRRRRCSATWSFVGCRLLNRFSFRSRALDCIFFVSGLLLRSSTAIARFRSRALDCIFFVSGFLLGSSTAIARFRSATRRALAFLWRLILLCNPLLLLRLALCRVTSEGSFMRDPPLASNLPRSPRELELHLVSDLESKDDVLDVTMKESSSGDECDDG